MKYFSLRRIPTAVWVLGFVSMLMDISSEMIHSLLPLFMVTTLGASTLMVGLIEGLAEATALIVKVFSGVISDYFGKRKWLAVTGYALGAFTKPVFALSSSLGLVLTARLTDRVGKGIRGAPRDALVADITPTVTVRSKPSLKGLPIAIAHSPISSLSESPKGATVTFSFSFISTFITAISVLGSKPTTVPV